MDTQNPYTREENEQAWTVWESLMRTGVNIFLTGNAGTGKTTFLQKLRESGMRKMVVTAPTGVAAINANGVTLHSFFQLPPGTYAPGELPQGERKINKEKRKAMQNMDLLVIDEVSMVRADLLDLVDARLREQRRDYRPFGGVQLLLIGDLMQLAPVVKGDEADILREYYPNCYFFSSRALSKTNFYTISLDKIYRQSDDKFINLLNHVRTATMSDADLALLNQRYIPDFAPKKDSGYIRMTTHVQSAEDINAENLASLKSQAVVYESKVENEFPEKSYPSATKLTLKKGAQVMFIKNGSVATERDEEGVPTRVVSYYNGMIVKAVELKESSVVVETETGDTFEVGYVKWENVKYEVNEETGDPEAKVIGTFSQIPLTLAWAITIHKSQGLTFDKAIIDASRSFSPGQVYVALSRCRTFEGLVLRSPIPRSAIMTDREIDNFYRISEQNKITSSAIEKFANEHSMTMMRELFSFNEAFEPMRKTYNLLLRDYQGRYPKCEEGLLGLIEKDAGEVIDMGNRFVAICQAKHNEIGNITADDALMARAKNGAKYFVGQLTDLQKKILDVASITPDDAVGRRRLQSLRQLFKQGMTLHIAELNAVAQEGFSSATILKARAKALNETDEQGEKKTDSHSLAEENEVVNKELFKALRIWRAKKAEEAGKPAFMIATNTTLFDIADMVPSTVKELAAANGMGKEKLRLYADEILNIVSRFRKMGVEPVRSESIYRSAKRKEKKDPKPDTRKVSLEAFRRLGSVDAVAKERGLKPATISVHLMTFVGKGLTTQEVMGEDRYARLSEIIWNMGPEGIPGAEVWSQFNNAEYHQVRKDLGYE